MSGNEVNRFRGVNTLLEPRTESGFGPLKKIGVPEPERKPDRVERQTERLERRLARIQERLLDLQEERSGPTSPPVPPAASDPLADIRRQFEQNPQGLVDALLEKLPSLPPAARACALHTALQPMSPSKFDAAMKSLKTPEERQAFRTEHSSCAKDGLAIAASTVKIQESVTQSVQARLRDNTQTPSLKQGDGTILVAEAQDKATAEGLLAEELPRGMKGPGVKTFDEYVNELIPGAKVKVSDSCVTVETPPGAAATPEQQAKLTEAAQHLFGKSANVSDGALAPAVTKTPVQNKEELGTLLPSVTSPSDWKQFQAYLRAEHGYEYRKTRGGEDGLIGPASLAAANTALSKVGREGLEQAFLEWKASPKNTTPSTGGVRERETKTSAASPSALSQFSKSTSDEKWDAVKNPAIASILQRELATKSNQSKEQMNWFYNAAKNEHAFQPRSDEASSGVSHFTTYMMHNQLNSSLSQIKEQAITTDAGRKLLLSCGYTKQEIEGFKQEAGGYVASSLPRHFQHQRALLEKYGVTARDIQGLLGN